MMSNNLFLGRNDPKKKLWRTIHRNMVKRLISHGYPSPKLSRQWDEFMLTADEEYENYSKDISEYREKRRKAAEAHKKRMNDMAQKAAEMRNAWSKEADSFIRICNELEKEMNTWEKEMAVKTENRIRHYGFKRLSGGYKRFHSEVQAKHQIKYNPESIQMPDLASEINKWLDHEPSILNTWEKNFCESVRIKIIAGRDMSPKQIAIIDKIRKKFT